MAFTVSGAQTMSGSSGPFTNLRYVTGTGNLSDLQTALSGAGISAVWNGSTLTISGGGTNICIAMCGSLVEQRPGNYVVNIVNAAYFCWASSSGSNTVTAAATALINATTVSVSSSANIIVGSVLQFTGTGITTGGENNSKYYLVTAVAGTTITLNTPLAAQVTSGATITIAGSSVLGLYSGGVSSSSVDIMYAGDATGSFTYGSSGGGGGVEGYFVSTGAMIFNSGSLTYSQTNRQEMDLHPSSYLYSNNVQFSDMVSLTQYSFAHWFYGNLNATSLTSISTFRLSTSPFPSIGLEIDGTATPNYVVPPLNLYGYGVGVTTPSAGAQIKVYKPNYILLGSFNAGASVTITAYDPAYYYFDSNFTWGSATTLFEIFRTFNVTWSTASGSAIGSASVPAKYVALGGSTPQTGGTQNIVSTPQSASFTTSSTSFTLRQSSKPAGTNYSYTPPTTQTGFVDDSTYNIYLVSYGYNGSFSSTSAKPASLSAISTSGINLTTSSAQNPLAAAVAYASVSTSQFSMNTGTNTLTISANCTIDQIGQYLLKHCYDNATLSFYSALNYTIATVSGTTLTTSVNIAINTGVTVSTGTVTTSLTTTGTVTLSGTAAFQAQYTTAGQSSGILTLTGLQSNSSVYIANASGVQQYFTTTSGTSVTVYSPAGAATTWTWKVAKYGYLPVTGTFTSNTVSSQVVTQLSDSGITQATVATVQGYTNLSSLDRLYDYAAYWEASSNTAIVYNRLVSKSSTQLSLGAINITTNATGALWTVTGTAPTATALTINTGSTFAAAGTSITSLTTTGSFTPGSVSIGFVYTTSVGTSAVLALNGIAVSSGTVGYAYVYVADGSGNVKDYQQLTGSTTTYSLSVAPGATGTWFWKVAQYGKIAATGTLTPGTGGTFTTTVSMATDSGISNTSVTSGVPAISSATTLTSLDNIYDYGAYYETTSPNSPLTIGSAPTGGIAYNRITSQSGAQINIGAANFTYSTANSTLWVVAGTLPTATALTINKGTILVNGTKFTSLSTTGTATFTGGITTNNAVIYSSSGNSGIVTITGLTSTYVYLQNNSAVQQDYQTNVTGTYTFYTPIGSTGSWIWVIKRAGYGYASGTITPATGGFFTAAPPQTARKNVDGTTMYTGSTNALITVSFTGTTESDILIGNGVVSVQNVLDATEQALVTNAGMIWLTVNSECSEFISAAGSFVFLSTGWRFAALNTSSPNATVNGFAISTDGTPLSTTVTSYASRKVTFLSSSQAADVATAVWAALTSTNTATAGTMGALLNDADLQAKLAAALSA